jgi:hypothetical protein
MPVNKTKPKTELGQHTGEVSGPPKIGKTNLMSNFPNALFILTEPGQGGLELNHWTPANWNGDQYVIKTANDFDQIFIELSKDSQGFQTLIIDTVDNMANIVTDTILKEYGIENLNDGALSFGKGTNLFERRLREYLHAFASLPMGLWMVSHLKETTITRAGKEPETAWRDTLNDRAKLIVHSMVDFIWMLRKEGKQRWIYTEGDLTMEAGSRSMNGKALPERIPMGKSGKEAYQNIVTAYYSGNGDKAATRKELITRVLHGESLLSEKAIDSFDVEKRVMQSRKKHVGFEDLEKGSLETLEGYLQHLRLKYKEGTNQVN